MHKLKFLFQESELESDELAFCGILKTFRLNIFLFSHKYLMYTVAKPHSKEKTEEPVTEDDEGHSPLYRVVRKILDESGLTDVIINSRILSNIDNQLRKILNLGKKAMRSGGKCFKALVAHNYEFKVYFHKTDKVKIKMKTETERLTAEKGNWSLTFVKKMPKYQN